MATAPPRPSDESENNRDLVEYHSLFPSDGVPPDIYNDLAACYPKNNEGWKVEREWMWFKIEPGESGSDYNETTDIPLKNFPPGILTDDYRDKILQKASDRFSKTISPLKLQEL